MTKKILDTSLGKQNTLELFLQDAIKNQFFCSSHL